MARPTASVLLPLPPFWVANTIVCIGWHPSDDVMGCLGYAELHRIRDAEQFLLETFRAQITSNQMPATVINHGTIAIISKPVQVPKCYQALTSVARCLTTPRITAEIAAKKNNAGDGNGRRSDGAKDPHRRVALCARDRDVPEERHHALRLHLSRIARERR